MLVNLKTERITPGLKIVKSMKVGRYDEWAIYEQTFPQEIL